MTEFEIHQLLTGSRYEFDLATIVMLALGFGAIALSRMHFTQKQRNALSLLYLLSQGFCLIRLAASIVRFGHQSAMLTAIEATYHPGNAWLQLPTVVLRAALVVALIYLGYRFLKTPPEFEGR